MPVIDLYSKRQKRLRGEVSDVFVYDVFPDKFRVQLCYMIHELMGDYSRYANTRQPDRKSVV